MCGFTNVNVSDALVERFEENKDGRLEPYPKNTRQHLKSKENDWL